MDRIRFKINGCEYSVGCEISSDVTLLDYIRDTLELRGTKYMCREAGCGACIVAAAKQPRAPILAINSCMVPITSCQDWDIETIEQLGNRNKGYNVLQRTLAEYNGSQCGYCSPGWIMSMYSLLQTKKDLTMLEIEQSFGSNICRCTGYRPILEAFKTFAKDSPKYTNIPDIEDLICKNSGQICLGGCDDDWCIVLKDEDKQNNIKKIQLKDGKYWFKAMTLRNIFDVLDEEEYDSYMLISGNTAKGVYPIDDYPRVLIDISGIKEIKGYSLDQNLIIGAGSTLTELINIFETISKEVYFNYLQKFYEHLKLVAHVAVRNSGSLAGNLMIKHEHNEFQSDIYLLLETVGAQVTVVNHQGTKQIITMQQFLNLNMKGQVIINVLLPPLNDDRVKVITYKVMPRSQNAHAIVNAGFLYEITRTNMVKISRIVYGGLSRSFNRARSTEIYLSGKMLFTNETLQCALNILKNEIVVSDNLPEPSTGYRKQLALALFYKSLLFLCPQKLGQKYRSEVNKIHDTRQVTNGSQVYDTNPSLWPLNQPIPKIEALIQCAGEAMYTEDMPTLPRQVSAAFVLSTIPKGVIVSIDPRQALKQPGVIAFYTAKDIPGINSFTPPDHPEYTVNEEVLCSGKVKYCGQPIAIIVAVTQYIADQTTKLVNIRYNNVEMPVLNVKVAKEDPNRLQMVDSSEAKDKGNDIVKILKGGNTIYGQYHFTLENLSCITLPTEEGIEVHATSQWMDATQVMISRALKIDENRIDIHVRRLGGAYGIKISRTIQVAVACSLVTQKLNRPCCFILPLTTTTRAMGKRFPCTSDYEVGVDKSGVIQYIKYNIYEDNGYTVNEKLSQFGVKVFNNCYNSSRWNYKCFDALTDTAKNTLFRSPGTLESIAMIEFIFEHISYELNLDPLQVRIANLNPKYNEIKDLISTVKTNSQYDMRRAAVTKFNAENRWRKRGLRFTLLRWTHVYSRYFGVNMSVYHADGSIAIIHGGIEIGQGINTKAAQICAYELNIPISKIQVKANSTINNPNSALTGGSLTTQNIGIGVQKCCKELLKRLEPIRSQMKNPTWEKLIAKAFESNIDLQTHGFAGVNDVQDYDVFGVTLAEIEIDVLTGELEVLRVDLLEDVGQSLSPEIDIGQIEGAFIMGLGYWTSEQLVLDPKSGELLTDRTWNYYVPQARDIPQDFRVYFRRNSYSNKKIYGSKGTSEPPICMSVVVPLAIKEAIASARSDSGISTENWLPIDGPYTVENICMACATNIEDFKFN